MYQTNAGQILFSATISGCNPVVCPVFSRFQVRLVVLMGVCLTLETDGVVCSVPRLLGDEMPEELYGIKQEETDEEPLALLQIVYRFVSDVGV